MTTESQATDTAITAERAAFNAAIKTALDKIDAQAVTITDLKAQLAAATPPVPPAPVPASGDAIYARFLAKPILNSDQDRSWSPASLTNFAKTFSGMRFFDSFAATAPLNDASFRTKMYHNANDCIAAGMTPILCFLNGADITGVSEAFIRDAVSDLVTMGIDDKTVIDLWNEATLGYVANATTAQLNAAEDAWFPHLLKLVAAARSVSSKIRLMGGGTFWASERIWMYADKLVGDPLFYYSVHMYTPHNFTHQGRPSNGNPPPRSVPYVAGAATSALRPWLDWLAANNIKGIIGECGVTVDAMSLSDRVKYVEEVYNLVKGKAPFGLWSDSHDADATLNASWFDVLNAVANNHDVLPEFKAVIG